MKYKDILKNMTVSLPSCFSKSIVKDKNDDLLICYHGSDENFNTFKKLSHFGTLKAAKSIDKLYDGNVYIYSVYLNISNPLEIKDYNNASVALPFDIWHQELITSKNLIDSYGTKIINYLKEYHLKDLYKNDKEILSMFDNKDNFIESAKPEYFYKEINFYKMPKFNTDKFISIIKNMSYDGFMYINEIEDKNSISWIILDSDQAVIIDKEIIDK